MKTPKQRREESEALGIKQNDVKVHHKAGCAICGDKEPHTHTQNEWRAELDKRG